MSDVGGPQRMEPVADDPTDPTDTAVPATARKRARRRRMRAMLMVGTVIVVGLSAALAVGLLGSTGTGRRSGAYLGPATVNGCIIKPATTCAGIDLSGADLSGADLTGAKLAGAKLRAAKLARATLSGADLRGADLTGATLDLAHFDGADISDAVFDGATGSTVGFLKVTAWQAHFVGASLPLSAFVDIHAYGLDFSGANLAETVWLKTGLSRTTLAGADLRAAELADMSFVDSSLARARLTGAKLQGSTFRNVDFTGADLSGADLGVVLAGSRRDPVQIDGSNFTGANLSGANLTRVEASDARFGGANFTRTNLGQAKGIWAGYLTGAVFSDTIMPNLTTASTLDTRALQYLGTELTPEMVGVSVRSENYLCGTLSCPDPAFFVTVHAGGTKVDVNIAVVQGCMAFGNQTRTFNVEGSTYHVFRHRDTFSWTAGVASNICWGSVYKVRVRSRDDSGVTSQWTDFVQLQADDDYTRICATCDVFN